MSREALLRPMILVLVVLLAACKANPAPTPTATPALVPYWNSTPWSTSAYPTPALTPATTFVNGQSEVPKGKALFVEAWQTTRGTGECGVPGFNIDEPTYRYLGGWLSGSVSNPTSNASRVLVGLGRDLAGSVGGGTSSRIVTADNLPYLPDAIPDWKVVIHAVDAQGAAVVTLEGNTVWLEPGGSWEFKVEEHIKVIQLC